MGEEILHHDAGVDLILANIELSGMEITLINAMSREFTMKSYLSELKKGYDYILIDCRSSLGMLTINALAAEASAAGQCIYSYDRNGAAAKAHGVFTREVIHVLRGTAIMQMVKKF